MTTVSRTANNVSSLFGCPECVWSSLLDWVGLVTVFFSLLSAGFERLFVVPPAPGLVGRPSLGVSERFVDSWTVVGLLWSGLYRLTGAQEL